jgi:hypothetical protein
MVDILREGAATKSAKSFPVAKHGHRHDIKSSYGRGTAAREDSRIALPFMSALTDGLLSVTVKKPGHLLMERSC